MFLTRQVKDEQDENEEDDYIGCDFKIVKELRGHSGRVNNVLYFPKIQKIVSCSLDKTIRIWGPVDDEIRISKKVLREEKIIKLSHQVSQIIKFDDTKGIFLCCMLGSNQVRSFSVDPKSSNKNDTDRIFECESPVIQILKLSHPKEEIYSNSDLFLSIQRNKNVSIFRYSTREILHTFQENGVKEWYTKCFSSIIHPEFSFYASLDDEDHSVKLFRFYERKEQLGDDEDEEDEGEVEEEDSKSNNVATQYEMKTLSMFKNRFDDCIITTISVFKSNDFFHSPHFKKKKDEEEEYLVCGGISDIHIYRSNHHQQQEESENENEKSPPPIILEPILKIRVTRNPRYSDYYISSLKTIFLYSSSPPNSSIFVDHFSFKEIQIYNERHHPPPKLSDTEEEDNNKMMYLFLIIGDSKGFIKLIKFTKSQFFENSTIEPLQEGGEDDEEEEEELKILRRSQEQQQENRMISTKKKKKRSSSYSYFYPNFEIFKNQKIHSSKINDISVFPYIFDRSNFNMLIVTCSHQKSIKITISSFFPLKMNDDDDLYIPNDETHYYYHTRNQYNLNKFRIIQSLNDPHNRMMMMDFWISHPFFFQKERKRSKIEYFKNKIVIPQCLKKNIFSKMISFLNSFRKREKKKKKKKKKKDGKKLRNYVFDKFDFEGFKVSIESYLRSPIFEIFEYQFPMPRRSNKKSSSTTNVVRKQQQRKHYLYFGQTSISSPNTPDGFGMLMLRKKYRWFSDYYYTPVYIGSFEDGQTLGLGKIFEPKTSHLNSGLKYSLDEEKDLSTHHSHHGRNDDRIELFRMSLSPSPKQQQQQQQTTSKTVMKNLIYEGEIYHYIMRHGKGLEYEVFSSGGNKNLPPHISFEGIFKHNRRHGRGEIFDCKNGIVVSGTWINGRLQKQKNMQEQRRHPKNSEEEEEGRRNDFVFESFRCPMIPYSEIQKHLKNSKILGNGAQGVVYEVKTSCILQHIKGLLDSDKNRNKNTSMSSSSEEEEEDSTSSTDEDDDQYVLSRRRRRRRRREAQHHHEKIVAVKIMKVQNMVEREILFQVTKRGIGLCSRLLSKDRENKHILPVYGLIRGYREIGYVMKACKITVNKVIADISSINRNNRHQSTSLLKLKEKKRILYSTANGMKALHSEHIMHRDLKWANVMLDYDNVVKITDFDTLKEDAGKWRFLMRVNSSVQQSSNVGTPGFLAPVVHPYANQLICSNCGSEVEDIIISNQLDFHVANCNLRPALLKSQIRSFPKHLIDLMILCWESDPLKRPSFDQIVQIFEVQYRKKNMKKKFSYSILLLRIFILSDEEDEDEEEKEDLEKKYTKKYLRTEKFLLVDLSLSKVIKWIETKKYDGAKIFTMVDPSTGERIEKDEQLMKVIRRNAQNPVIEVELDVSQCNLEMKSKIFEDEQITRKEKEKKEEESRMKEKLKDYEQMMRIMKEEMEKMEAKNLLLKKENEDQKSTIESLQKLLKLKEIDKDLERLKGDLKKSRSTHQDDELDEMDEKDEEERF